MLINTTNIVAFLSIGGSVFVTGIDVDILSAEGPDMGDIIVDSIFNSHIDEDEEIGESLPRKLYNYFFGSKNSRKQIYNTMIVYWNI